MYDPKAILKDNPELCAKIEATEDPDQVLALVEFAHVPLHDEAGNDRAGTVGDLADWAGFVIVNNCTDNPGRVEVARGVRGMVEAPQVSFAARDPKGAWAITSKSFQDVVNTICRVEGTEDAVIIRGDEVIKPTGRSWLDATWYAYRDTAAMERDAMLPTPRNHFAVISVTETDAIVDASTRSVKSTDVESLTEMAGSDLTPQAYRILIKAADCHRERCALLTAKLEGTTPISEFVTEVAADVEGFTAVDVIVWTTLVSNRRMTEHYRTRLGELNVALLAYPTFHKRMSEAFSWLRSNMPGWTEVVGPPPGIKLEEQPQ